MLLAKQLPVTTPSKGEPRNWLQRALQMRLEIRTHPPVVAIELTAALGLPGGAELFRMRRRNPSKAFINSRKKPSSGGATQTEAEGVWGFETATSTKAGGELDPEILGR